MRDSAFTTADTPRDVRIITIVDADDPQLDTYRTVKRLDLWVLPQRLGFTASLNLVARDLWDTTAILGAFGDDVLFRTAGWDSILRDTLQTPGMAYGDDLIHGVNHPSAVFMSGVIAKALGWLALPATKHQWADDAWKALGAATGCLRYMDGIVFEHLHPAVGKAETDETYAWNFGGTPEAEARAKADFDGYTAWTKNGLLADRDRVRTVL